MSILRDLLKAYVGDGSVPGVVGLVARGGGVEVEAVGSVDVDGTSPMARNTIFRIASVSKPVIAAAVMSLVDDGRIALDDPISSPRSIVTVVHDIEAQRGPSGVRRCRWSLALRRRC
ncbi:serine hydrolase domain-containing protein [Sphaerisporangium sp. NPDC088356]|uniref:serine hydrolase domain-containing protein n=1 Tax=Sphaerisporangium sp. NPDC088356 TaxID=3154871 RepID=UPI00342FD7B0